MAKRQLDIFDLEAEREGSAVKRHTVLRSAWEKGTIKSRRGRKDAEAAIERRTVKVTIQGAYNGNVTFCIGWFHSRLICGVCIGSGFIDGYWK